MLAGSLGAPQPPGPVGGQHPLGGGVIIHPCGREDSPLLSVDFGGHWIDLRVIRYHYGTTLLHVLGDQVVQYKVIKRLVSIGCLNHRQHDSETSE